MIDRLSLLLALTLCSCTPSSTTDPFKSPAKIWSSAMLGSGRHIVLLDDGRYASREICDICNSPDIAYGHWTKDQNTYRLVSDESNTVSVLVLGQVEMCQVLRDFTPGRKYQTVFYELSARHCREVVLNTVRRVMP